MAAMAKTSITLYGIPNCDTVKKARAWLTQQGAEFEFHDFRKAGVPADQLQLWLDRLGWEQVLNKRGTTWRKLEPARQQAITDAASAAAWLTEAPSAIKRPVMRWPDGGFSVGFDAADWQQRLDGHRPAD